MKAAYPNSLLHSDIKTEFTYFERFQSVDNEDFKRGEKLQRLTDFFEKMSSHNSVLVLAWDIISDRFVYALDKRKVVGHDITLYLDDNGIQFSLSNMHPDFFKANVGMQTASLKYLIQYQGKEITKITFNSDGRYKKSNGEYFHFLQQTSCIETDSNGSPLLFLAYIHDITHIKKWESSNLIITTPDEIKLWNYNYDENCLEPLHPFSKQEKKILCCLAQGKSSKAIAEELFISPNTVDTHRRNLLERTNCINTTGLVTYAKLVGLL